MYDSTHVKILGLIALLLFVCTSSVSAGIRGAGKYSGVVIFDRWGTCLLVSGPYVMYISEDTKSDLRSYAGSAVQINALEVVRPKNPGDGLVKKYSIIGSAPEPSNPERLDGLNIEVKDSFSEEGKPRFLITMTNQARHDIEVSTDEVGITVLGNRKSPFSPSDGPSEAVITRAGLDSASEWSSSWS